LADTRGLERAEWKFVTNAFVAQQVQEVPRVTRSKAFVPISEILHCGGAFLYIQVDKIHSEE